MEYGYGGWRMENRGQGIQDEIRRTGMEGRVLSMGMKNRGQCMEAGV